MGNIKLKFRLRALLYVFILLLLCIVKTKSQDATQALTNLDRRFFIENKGQWPDEVLYLTRMGGLDVWITKQGVNYTFYKIEKDSNAPKREEDDFLPDKFRHDHANEILLGHRVIMDLVGSNANPQREGKQKQEGYYNYLIGNDPSKHATYVGLYKEAIIKNVYEGIDVRYYFDKGGLRYDYIVQPGADPNQIVFKLRGQEKEYLKSNNIAFTTRFGEVQMRELYVYQSDGKKVEAMFICKNNQWRIALGQYDQNQPLIIDPLIYSTYIGGSGTDAVNDIVLDGSGNAYITGYTISSNYDITPGAFQTTHGGGYYDVFVTKLNSTGTGLVYSTYIGGNGDDRGKSIALDGSGNVYVTGGTSSSNYDVTPGAFQTTYGGGTYDVFVTKLNATGTALVYSTYLGGNSYEFSYGIAVDGSGYAYVTGETFSLNYPVTTGVFQTTNGGQSDAFVTKLNATGTSLVYSTYLGGSGDDIGYSIALDGSGNAYITGYTTSSNYDVTSGAFQTTYEGGKEVFVTKINPAGSGLVYSTYIGGSSNDESYGIAVDGSGQAYVTGYTFSYTYDVMSGAFQTFYRGNGDVFVTKLNATGTSLLYSTYLGGSFDDKAYGIALDGSGNAYVTGYTFSTNYPVTTGAFQTSLRGAVDAFVTKLNPTGTSLLYSTYLGGSDDDYAFGIALDGNGNAYVTGETTSSNYDVTTGAFQTTYGGDGDVFVTKLCLKGVTLTSAPGTDNQTVCINTPITTINYSTLGVTNIGTTTGLPDGLMSFSVFNTLSISGTPTVSGTFTYTIPMTVDCGTIYVTGTINVEPDNTFTLTSDPGTDNQTACLNTAITDITYATMGATGIGTPTGLPAGITANFLSDVITISGSPTELGTFNYTIPLTGGCGNVSINGIITIEPDNTVTLSSTSSDNQTVCVNTPIADISYVTTGATGIGTPTGLPAGITASFASDTITISGTPTESGTFNYSIPLTGGCGNVNATGTIIVNPDNMSTALASASGTDHQTLCINTSLSPIIYTTVGATGIGVPVGLPTGVTASWNMNVLMINGTPSESGTFNYSIPLTGGCGNVSATGTITVIPDNTASLLSSAGTDSQTVCVNTAITSIVYTTTGATGIGTPTNLPAGVTANWSANVILISGTPTQTGIFNYSIPMTGGCGNVNVTGTITVNSCSGISETNANVDFMVYPNPNQGTFTIRTTNGGTFELIDAQGQILKTYTLPNDSEKLIEENLSPGIYIMRAKDSGEKIKIVLE
ncbi:MAG TPA: SBBP repeat-containing protein [Bacteroidales bacterium]|jgi:hypothetical protein|nr:SBBP repeat-containing protein [Bacteroidales bacterium]HOL97783.1 SBBP repeat-containing protein [Bacteroidales bacterium]HOM35832.1 SBBP repeat-containing protein [Bacteroidales bacterium]HPD23248.1 SBBP repeat-containing protein [Bacteroidales bacterium]HRS99252.1 SBBP repeat-containing protein [Bacteroidales bacterium]